MSETQKLAAVAGHSNFLNQVGSGHGRRKINLENKTFLGISGKAALTCILAQAPFTFIGFALLVNLYINVSTLFHVQN
jgi:hypothetical protein